MHAWYDHFVSMQVITNKYTQYMYMCCLRLLYRFMKTPDRLSALRNARDTIRKRNRKIAMIKVRLESLTSQRGIAVESDIQEEIDQVIHRETPAMESLPASDFKRIFWEQQVCLC